MILGLELQSPVAALPGFLLVSEVRGCAVRELWEEIFHLFVCSPITIATRRQLKLVCICSNIYGPALPWPLSVSSTSRLASMPALTDLLLVPQSFFWATKDSSSRKKQSSFPAGQHVKSLGPCLMWSFKVILTLDLCVCSGTLKFVVFWGFFKLTCSRWTSCSQLSLQITAKPETN